MTTNGICVLVCGGRGYQDKAKLFAFLDLMHATSPFSKVVHGGANGADRIAGLWAAARHVSVAEYPADWHRYGRSAGPRRNQRMLEAERIDLCVAFPGGSGTADMVARCRQAGVQVEEVA